MNDTPRGPDDLVFELLRHRRLPLAWLAERSGIDVSTLSRVQSHERPFRPVQRVAIASALDMPLAMLFPEVYKEAVA